MEATLIAASSKGSSSKYWLSERENCEVVNLTLTTGHSPGYFMEMWGTNLCFGIMQQFCCSFVPFTLLLTPYRRLVWMRYIGTITRTWLLAHQKWSKTGVGVSLKEGGRGDHWVMWHEHLERWKKDVGILTELSSRAMLVKCIIFTHWHCFSLLGQGMHL